MWEYQDTTNWTKQISINETKIFTAEDAQFEVFFSIQKFGSDGGFQTLNEEDTYGYFDVKFL